MKTQIKDINLRGFNVRSLPIVVYIAIAGLTSGCLSTVDHSFVESTSGNGTSGNAEIGALYNDESMAPSINDNVNPLAATEIEDTNGDGLYIAAHIGTLGIADEDWWVMTYSGGRFYPSQEFYFGFYGPGRVKVRVFKKPEGKSMSLLFEENLTSTTTDPKHLNFYGWNDKIEALGAFNGKIFVRVLNTGNTFNIAYGFSATQLQ